MLRFTSPSDLPMQYAPIFKGCQNDNFYMKKHTICFIWPCVFLGPNPLGPLDLDQFNE